ncbi:glutamyl-tRNA(Gln) amidotransferase subunit A [Coleophoma crateriformis]|uniref:Glutamyl-tRNA(Gln) amidotransferase subunit A n=1 Tax=Coleophoma crateriformis TaxID=565419 RepID=A0A3D8QC60_9HELO|nr:glutamyl-tRNA(Gln) amidotransferase subunit A [Coleophoma crateriformis]
MIASLGDDGRFLNYPEPVEGPDVPLKRDTKSNPALTGIHLLIAVWLLEHFGWLRRLIWRNTGFNKLRLLQEYIENVEPRHNPNVVPISPKRKSEQPEPANAESAPESFRPKYYSSADYHQMYLTGELTPTAVAKALLPLIRRDISPAGPFSIGWHDSKVDMVMAAAEASTLRYKKKCPIGPLDGVPTGVKDDYDLEGYRTNLGSANEYTAKPVGGGCITSWCVKKLEESGALILGKLTMPEFGMDTCGNNPVYGTPPNPHNPQYYTGASSSGSAYAVSVGLIPFALGGDGGGSVRIPASFCSVYGLKTTHGRISQAPSANHANTCAVNGPLASDIRSLAAVYHVMATPHPTSDFPPTSPISLSVSSPSSPQRILGVPDEWISGATPRTQYLCRSMLEKLSTAYNYKLVSIKIPFLVEGQLAHAMTMLADAATLLPSTHNITAPNKVLVALGSVTPATDYLLAQKLRHLLMQHLAHLWKQYPGMIIVTPTTSCEGWPFRHPKSEFKYGLSDGDTTLKTMEYVWMANFCGMPSLALPVGFAKAEGTGEENVPVGMMGMAEWGGEDELLQWGLDAEALSEDVTRRPPIWVDVVEKAKLEMTENTNGLVSGQEALVDI